jgi:predicted dehydrogenase
MINLSYRDSSAVQEAIKIVARGELGEIRHVHGHYLQSWLAGTTSWGHWQDPNWLWRLQTAQGSMGVLGDLGCHLLDLLTAVAGDVDTVESRLTTFPKVDRKGTQRTSLGATRLDANDTATIQLKFANGAAGVCHTTRWATGHMNSIFLGVHGTDGALRIDLDQGKDKLQLCRGRNKAVGRWSTRTIRTTPSIYQRFIRSIQTRRQDQPDVPRGAQIQSLLDACQRSSQQNGKPTRVRKWV